MTMKRLPPKRQTQWADVQEKQQLELRPMELYESFDFSLYFVFLYPCLKFDN